MTNTSAEILELAAEVERMDWTPETLDAIEQALRDYAELLRPQWRDIADAPKDGTRIIVFDPRYPGVAISVAWWRDDERESWNGEEVGAWIDGTVADWNMQEYCHLKPTHWVPLPPEPVSRQQDGTT